MVTTSDSTATASVLAIAVQTARFFSATVSTIAGQAACKEATVSGSWGAGCSTLGSTAGADDSAGSVVGGVCVAGADTLGASGAMGRCSLALPIATNNLAIKSSKCSLGDVAPVIPVSASLTTSATADRRALPTRCAKSSICSSAPGLTPGSKLAA